MSPQRPARQDGPVEFFPNSPSAIAGTDSSNKHAAVMIFMAIESGRRGRISGTGQSDWLIPPAKQARLPVGKTVDRDVGLKQSYRLQRAIHEVAAPLALRGTSTLKPGH